MATYDMKSIGVISSGVTSATIIFGAIGGQTDSSPVPIAVNAFVNYINTNNLITSLGTVTAGVWNGSVIGSAYGGTGMNNGSNTISLGGNLTTSGAYPLTLTLAGSTNITLPTSGTLVSSAVTSLPSLTSAASLATVGTITTGVWNGTTIAIANGGTGQTTKSAAYQALSPITTQGDLVVGGASGVPGRLPIGTNNYVLSSNGTTAGWVNPSSLPTLAAGSNTQIQYNSSGSLAGSSNLTVSGSALSIGVAGSATGSIVFGGATSGSTTVTANVTASGTLTLPAATDTLIGKATTDTLTNKTFDTAGSGNVFKIAGNGISGVTGTGSSVVLATSPTLVTPTLGVATATSVNGLTITTSTGTLTVTNGKTISVSNTLTLTGTDGSSIAFGSGGTVAYLEAAQTFSALNTFSAGLALNGSNILAPAANVVAIENSTTAQTLRVAQSYTNASNGCWMGMNMTTAGVALLEATGNGTGASTLTQFSVAVNGTTGLTVLPSGSVGIGITSPTSKQQIQQGATGANAPTTISLANNYLQIGGADYNLNAYRLIGFGYAPSGNTNFPAYIGYQETVLSGQSTGDLIFGTRSVTTDTAPTERMRITNGGNVGIGTSSPGCTLDVAGSIRIRPAATLPSSPAAGQIAAVNTATSPTVGSVLSLGGSAYALAQYNGTVWHVMGI